MSPVGICWDPSLWQILNSNLCFLNIIKQENFIHFSEACVFSFYSTTCTPSEFTSDIKGKPDKIEAIQFLFYQYTLQHISPLKVLIAGNSLRSTGDSFLSLLRARVQSWMWKLRSRKPWYSQQRRRKTLLIVRSLSRQILDAQFLSTFRNGKVGKTPYWRQFYLSTSPSGTFRRWLLCSI